MKRKYKKELRWLYEEYLEVDSNIGLRKAKLKPIDDFTSDKQTIKRSLIDYQTQTRHFDKMANINRRKYELNVIDLLVRASLKK